MGVAKRQIVPFCRIKAIFGVIAAAPTCGAAWALAHRATSQRAITASKSTVNHPNAAAYMISRTRLRRYLARLPIAALRIDTDIADHTLTGRSAGD